MARPDRANAPLSTGFDVADELDERIAAMRRLLAAMAPSTTSAALRTLRNAFPDEPLGLRLRALKEMH